MNFQDYRNMLQDIKHSDGLKELLFFMFSSPSKTYKHRLNNDLQPSQASNDTVKKVAIFMLMIITVLLLLIQFAYAQPPANPSAADLKDCNLLFFLQCDPDANTFVYELNYNSAGKLQADTPIKASWIRTPQDHKFRALSSIDKKFAYGVQSKQIGDEEYEIRLVAYKKMPLYLKKSAADNKYHMYVKDEGENLLLKRVFVKITKGNFRFPKVRYIDLITTNSATGMEILKRIRT